MAINKRGGYDIMQKNLNKGVRTPIINKEVQESITYLADILVEGFLSQYEHTNNQQKSSDILPSFDKGTS